MTEEYELIGAKEVLEFLTTYPDYKTFWRAGYSFRGATEKEVDRDYLKGSLGWAAASDVKIDHKAKEIHVNGFSENDLL